MSRLRAAPFWAVLGLLAAWGAGAASAAAPPDEDRQIADSLAAMLRAGRVVISSNQARINDPSIGPKGLDGATVLARSIDNYQHDTGLDPRTLDPASRHGRLLNDEMQAIKEVLDANQPSIDAVGTGFKGFIPAVFSRLVSEAFSRRAAGEAEMRVTAPIGLVRNRKSRPDAWEMETIEARFQSPGWPTGQSFEARTELNGRETFRIAVPEYYASSCLSCHGGPRGEMDLTGYPKEGASLGDLGGVISIKLAH